MPNDYNSLLGYGVPVNDEPKVTPTASSQGMTTDEMPQNTVPSMGSDSRAARRRTSMQGATGAAQRTGGNQTSGGQTGGGWAPPLAGYEQTSPGQYTRNDGTVGGAFISGDYSFGNPKPQPRGGTNENRNDGPSVPRTPPRETTGRTDPWTGRTRGGGRRHRGWDRGRGRRDGRYPGTPGTIEPTPESVETDLSVPRAWGETRPGEMYPQVEGPGNPSWEKRNPGGMGWTDLNQQKSQIPRTAEEQAAEDRAAELRGLERIKSFGGVHVLNEQDLQKKREELAAAGIPPEKYGNFISTPDADGKIYYITPEQYNQGFGYQNDSRNDSWSKHFSNLYNITPEQYNQGFGYQNDGYRGDLPQQLSTRAYRQ